MKYIEENAEAWFDATPTFIQDLNMSIVDAFFYGLEFEWTPTSHFTN